MESTAVGSGVSNDSIAPEGDNDLTIRLLTEEWAEAVGAFNERLRGAPRGLARRFPARPSPRWAASDDGQMEVFRQYFIATHGDAVRGGYVLKNQPFHVQGNVVPVGNIQLPISEGVVNRKYALLAWRLLNDALDHSPLLYALGLGGYDRPLAKLLAAAGWRLQSVPMYACVIRASAVLRHLPPFRATRFRRAMSASLAATGLASVACASYNAICRLTPQRKYGVAITDEFDSSFDLLWNRTFHSYSFIGQRTSGILERLYPRNDTRFIRMRLEQDGQLAGWVVLLNTQHNNSPHFGSMRVGVIVDCLAVPSAEMSLITAATSYLAENGADVVISNQSDPVWRKAFLRSGYLSARSNFIFASSPELTTALSKASRPDSRLHITRGDGDGPINL